MNPFFEFCKIFLKSLSYAVCWIIAFSVFGFIQIVIIYIFSITDKSGCYDMSIVLNNGFILFFSLAMLTSAIIDTFIDKSPTLDNRIILIVFLFTFLLIIIVSVSFTRIYITNNEQKNPEFVKLNIISLISSYIFAIFLKTIIKYKKIRE
jgi:hypothetical protein